MNGTRGAGLNPRLLLLRNTKAICTHDETCNAGICEVNQEAKMAENLFKPAKETHMKCVA